MSPKDKISSNFIPFLADSKPEDKRDAIVIFNATPVKQTPARGRLRKLKQRLDFIKEQAAAQQPLQKKLFKTYQKEGAKQLKHGSELEVSPIGSTELPIASVEVTRKTLTTLAEMPAVIAILPNQRIHLIKPKAVDYDKLTTQENNDGLTWGLKRLSIPQLWQTTKGDEINVAVLDTGVHGDHPALAGKVKKFVIIDPLGRRIIANPSFDGGSHGTHVCGTIAGGLTSNGVAIGVAPEANLLVGGVLVGDATLRTLLEGIFWAVENGADIINMSLGFTYSAVVS